MMLNVPAIFSILVIFVIVGQTEAEITKNKDITSLLTKYEITTIIDVDRRSPRRKYTEKGAEKSFQIKAFGNTFIIDLSIYYPRQDSEIVFTSYHKNNSGTFYNSKFLLHQGYVRNAKDSFVLGYFVTGYPFRGYVVTDEVYCIEPYKSDKVVVYRFSDVITPGCVKKSEDEDLDCSETRYFVPWSGKRVPIVESIHLDYNMLYNRYIEFYHRINAQKAKLEKQSGEKNNSSTGENNKNEHKTHPKNKHKTQKAELKRQDGEKNNTSISEHKKNKHKTQKVELKQQDGEKNNTSVDEHNKNKHKAHPKNKHKAQKAELKKQDRGKNNTSVVEVITNKYKTHRKSNFKIVNILDLSEKNESKTEDEEEEESDDDDDYDDDDDDDDDDKDDDNNDKLLSDEDRFAVSASNLTYPIYLLDKEFPPKDIETYQKQQVNNIKPLVEALTSDFTEALQCNVEVVVAPSLIQRFDNKIEMAVKDVLTQFTLLNKIFFKVPFRKGGKLVRFTVHVAVIALHADEVYSPFTTRADLEYFMKTHHPDKEHCLDIGLVNQYLKSGDLFDGYTPEGKGGICAKDGDVLLASHGNENNPAPMALYFANILRGVTRAMGAIDKDEKCSGGVYPNPMQILKNYLLTDRIELDPEYSIFTTCNVKEIESNFNVRGCLETIFQPLCGNAVLDPGEECDCGPVAMCNKIDTCCNAQRLSEDPEYKSCTLKASAQCSVLQDCCNDCEISTYEDVCYSGVGDCDIARCNGKSGSCPTGVEFSNGMICYNNESHPEPLVCKDNKCDQLLCSSFDLQPCTCLVGSEKECHYCCVKDGKCQTADHELKLFPDRNFYLPDDTECSMGFCQEGICREMHGERHSVKKRPHFHFTASDGPIQFKTFYIIINSILSFLILCILKFRF